MKRILSLLCMLFLLAGCASKGATDPQDPYESYNIKMFIFNAMIDMFIYRPPAVVYTKIVPVAAQKGVTNLFNNLAGPTTTINDLLQRKPNYALIDATRLAINSTIGIAGLFDVAARLGLPSRSNGFSNTLAFYSDNPNSPYLVLPFLGPSTPRDAFGMGVDTASYIATYIPTPAATWTLYGLNIVSVRAAVLPLDPVIRASFNPYAFVRDAYLQTRQRKIQQILTEGDWHYSRKAHYDAEVAALQARAQHYQEAYAPKAIPTSAASQRQTLSSGKKLRHQKPQS